MPRSRNDTIARLPVNPYLANALSFCVALLTASSPTASWTRDTVRANHTGARRVFIGDAPPEALSGVGSCPRPRNCDSDWYFGGYCRFFRLFLSFFGLFRLTEGVSRSTR